jgi:hypothetical protein
VTSSNPVVLFEGWAAIKTGIDLGAGVSLGVESITGSSAILKVRFAGRDVETVNVVHSSRASVDVGCLDMTINTGKIDSEDGVELTVVGRFISCSDAKMSLEGRHTGITLYKTFGNNAIGFKVIECSLGTPHSASVVVYLSSQPMEATRSGDVWWDQRERHYFFGNVHVLVTNMHISGPPFSMDCTLTVTCKEMHAPPTSAARPEVW